MPVTNDEEFRAWLARQSQEVCTAIAYRAAMRVLPFAMDLERTEPRNSHIFVGADFLALVTFRAALTSGVAAKWPTRELKDDVLRSLLAAHKSASSASHFEVTPTSTAQTAAVSAAAFAAAFTVRTVADSSLIAAKEAVSSATFAAGVSFPVPADSSILALRTAAFADIYSDTELKSEALPDLAIGVCQEVEELVDGAFAGRRNALDAGGPWTFWAEWYGRAMAGDPLDWKLQEQIALIPDEIWKAGPEAAAEEIARIEDEYWSRALPQAETLVRLADGRFDVRADPTPDGQRIVRMLGQVQFALDLALRTNCGFNEMCVAFKYLHHTLEKCRDDPNAIEQQFRQARDILKRKMANGTYDPDDALQALVDGLDQHALQLRGSHPAVRAAYEVRVQQKLREVDDATLKMVVGGMRAFQEDRTAGRLYHDTGLDAETVERDNDVEAKATAIRRTGGRAAQANVVERASQIAKDVDASGGYKGARIGATGWTFVEMLKSVFGG